MKTLIALLFTCQLAMCQFGGFNLLTAHQAFGPRPPTMWVDVIQAINAGMSSGDQITACVDYSGRGKLFEPLFYPAFTVSPCYQFNTDFGPSITATSSPSGNQYLTFIDTNSIPNTTLSFNAGTIAVRLYYVSGTVDWFVCDPLLANDVKAHESTAGVDSLYFDWGAVNNYRISIPNPGDLTNDWHTLIYVHGQYGSINTNSTIWYDGAVLNTTNLATGVAGGTRQDIRLIGSITLAQKYYVKRILAWDYIFGTNEIAHLFYYMQHLP